MTNEFVEDTDLSFLDCVEFEEDTPAPSRGKSTAKVREFLGITFTMTVSDETRAKMSALKKGKIPDAAGWNKGKSHSEETRAKMSAAKKGRLGHTKNTGKSRSAETRAKISAANSLAQSKPVMTPLGQFASTKLAAEAYGLKSKEAILYRIKNKPTEYYYI